jgi:hypothetical protein
MSKPIRPFELARFAGRYGAPHLQGGRCCADGQESFRGEHLGDRWSSWASWLPTFTWNSKEFTATSASAACSHNWACPDLASAARM